MDAQQNGIGLNKRELAAYCEQLEAAVAVAQEDRSRRAPATDDECDELHLLCVLCWTGSMPTQLRGEAAAPHVGDEELVAAIDRSVQVEMWPGVSR